MVSYVVWLNIDNYILYFIARLATSIYLCIYSGLILQY